MQLRCRYPKTTLFNETSYSIFIVILQTLSEAIIDFEILNKNGKEKRIGVHKEDHVVFKLLVTIAFVC